MALDIYDKISIDENYGSEMQKRSHVWESANSRKNAADMPNATTVVFMEDTHDGGVTITTGDFVAFFNRQYGCDRVGNMRRSLAQAKRNCELKEAKEGKARAKSDAKPQAQRASRRPLRPRFSFVKAVFGMMLVLAIGLLVATGLMLEQSHLEVAKLEQEVAVLQESVSNEVFTQKDASSVVAATTSLDGEDGVEIYPVEEDQFVMAELLNAFASLWE
ncbi:MAG: hypothetical protein E7624_00825 [Ruminococcaceae bacterium]|nr:hypothetical protein [Oscillospiraceae bacterium]